MNAQAVTIVVPAAGEGSRFARAGFAAPKPFIRIRGVPMVSLVIGNLRFANAQYVLIARSAHVERDPEAVRALTGSGRVEIALLDHLTEGTACTILSARDRIPPDQPLLIANSDQLVRGGIAAMLEDAFARKLDGSIMVFPEAGDPKWSFAKCDADGFVTEVAEKVAISKLATVGIYYFRTAQLFFDAAQAMIRADDRVNGEFYTCPVYNYLIRAGGKVGVFTIEPDWMSGLGTPEDLAKFEAAEIERYLPRAGTGT